MLHDEGLPERGRELAEGRADHATEPRALEVGLRVLFARQGPGGPERQPPSSGRPELVVAAVADGAVDPAAEAVGTGARAQALVGLHERLLDHVPGRVVVAGIRLVVERTGVHALGPKPADQGMIGVFEDHPRTAPELVPFGERQMGAFVDRERNDVQRHLYC